MPNPLRDFICVICESPFQSRTKTAQTCSRHCRAVLREQNKAVRGRPKIQYPADLVERVRKLYEAGHNIAETAEAAGTTSKVVWRLMQRHDIPRRKAIPRDQRGERSSSWKGDSAGYQALHLRVEAARGKPNRCATCDTTDPSERYEWANLSGRYEDINDYARLCVTCHRRLDAARRAATGQPTGPSRGR